MQVTDSTAVAVDVTVISLAGVSLQCVKILCVKKLNPFIARKFFGLLHDERLVYNLSRQAWKLLWHLSQLILEIVVLIPSAYWTCIIYPYNRTYGTSLFWEYSNQDAVPLGIRVLYLLQIGYYTTDFFYINLVDKQSDIVAMSVHHLSTLALLWMSYLPPHCYKIGTAVLLVHEIGDVSLYLCKTLHYAQFELTSNVLFVIHIGVWIWSRLIWFPRYIASLWIDVDKDDNIWQVWPCAILLCILLLLHVFWTYLMLKALYKAVVSKEPLSDPRDQDTRRLNGEEKHAANNASETAHDHDDVDEMHQDDLEPLELNEVNGTDRTQTINKNETVKRRRSSLMGSLIQDQNALLASTNGA